MKDSINNVASSENANTIDLINYKNDILDYYDNFYN